jgi:formylmethanofuran dehydrogenase subunit B
MIERDGGIPLSSRTLVCTGCGCLCDDIQVEVDGAHLGQIENACAKGAAYLQAAFNPERRAQSTIRGQGCSPDAAIDEAARLLSKAKHRLIFGLDNSTLETQVLAIELAQKLGAVLDDASSFSYGPLIERIIKKELPTCSLSEVKDKADLLLYWGANPTATHPRHLSKYTYYAYAEFNPAGWYPKVTLSSIDVRQTELTTMSQPAFRIKPRGDRDLISGLLGESPAASDQARQLSELVKKSHFGAMFCGLGLVHSLGGDFSAFTRMVQLLSQSIRVAVIPMIAETNMLGFSQSLHKQTSYVNSVSFASGVSHERQFSFLEQVHHQAADCILIVGSDPFSTLPQSLLIKLQGVDVICLDHSSTLTTEAADVVLPTAVPGLESGGSVVRLDGDGIALAQPIKDGYPTQEDILRQLRQKVQP